MRSHLSKLANFDHRLFRVMALAWMALIFYLSSQEFIPVPGVIEGQDKLMHFGAYAALGLFIAGGWRRPGQVLSWRDLAMAVLVVIAYGASDEFHQSFVPGRDVSTWDLVADSLGGMFGAWLIYRGRAGRIRPPT